MSSGLGQKHHRNLQYYFNVSCCQGSFTIYGNTLNGEFVCSKCGKWMKVERCANTAN